MSVLSLILKPLAYLGVPVFLLHTASRSSPVARYYVRLTLYLSTIGLCSAWGAVVSFAMALAGQRFNVNWVIARTFYAVASRVMDIKISVEGEEHLDTRPAVLVGNHQSMLDILYLGRIFPLRASIMAKKELQWMPLLGQYLTASGAVFVDRGNNAKAVRSLAAAGESMHARTTSLWLFPEGTRSMRPYHDMLPFKKGAFHLAVQAGVPIVPVVCENYWRLYRENVFESGTLKLRVLPPISTTGLTVADVADLTIRVREQMIAALREISDPNAPPPPPTSAPSTSKSASPSPTPAPQTEADLKVDSRAPPSQSPAEATSAILEPESTEAAAAAVQATERPSEKEVLEPSPSETSSRPSSEAEEAEMSRRRESSENGTETEEDEGMVLVGRPS